MKRELAFNHAPSYGVPDKLAVSGGRLKRFVPPMRARLFRADGRLTDYSRCGATNLNGNCTICFTFRPPDSAGWNRHSGSDGYPGIGLPSRAMTGLSTCDANIGSPESDPVDDPAPCLSVPGRPLVN